MSENENENENENEYENNKRKNYIKSKRIHELKKRLLERDGATCQISGEPFLGYDDMVIDHILPLRFGGTDNLENKRLVKASINSALSNKDIHRIETITKDLLKRQEELTKREQESFDREKEYRQQIDKQKQELERLRGELQSDYELRIFRVDQELRSHQDRIKEEQAELELRELEASLLKQTLQKQFDEQELQHKIKLDELEKEKERYREESRNQIQARSNSYVNEAISALDTSAESYHFKGTLWSIAGLLSLSGGVGTGIYFGLAGLTALEDSDKISWPVVSFLAFKGIIVIGLFIALAKYCFTYSQSFTHEAIKNSERKHAINFGKFYLESYGAEAQWGQVKEAFEHWNINSSSAFSGADSDKFDPKIFDKAISIAEAVQKFGKSNKEETKKK
jgi:5-methylcytosine-specific restriction endonuclease McrA